jgi:hypothetical protein
MRAHKRNQYLLAVLIFLSLSSVGSYKLVESHVEYMEITTQIEEFNIRGVDRYFENNTSMSKEKAKELIGLASSRDIDNAYILPLLYFTLLIVNLFLIGLSVDMSRHILKRK